MKILVLNGSPKVKSDTFRLTDAFLKGMSQSGEHEIHIVHVRQKKIAPCRGCFGCWQRGDGHCVIADDQNAILDLYRDADVIIWSFPLYCYGMPSHLKAVLDRTIPLVKMNMVRQPDGTVRHEALVDFSGIHTLVICGCGFPHWEGNFDGLKRCARSALAIRISSAYRKRLCSMCPQQPSWPIRCWQNSKRREKNMPPRCAFPLKRWLNWKNQ